MAKSKRNNNAQFTYDFGIAIAQSTVSKITKLTGATLTLASAFYALKSTAYDYISTLKDNTLIFGGVLSTMKAMEQAQNRLIKGQSYFKVDDQLKGMRRLMAVGIDVGENFEWLNKAAHAIGKSYEDFSGMIASAIQGNAQTLVDAGLMTQRATRMFDKYEANTIMRQKAIFNFVKTHKGLMSAIRNDFETIQDQMIRLKGIWKAFLSSIVGKPNDPQSFYGQIVSSMRMVATALARNMEQIKRYGFIIGQTLGWVIKQIGHFVVWVGRQVKKTLASVWTVTEDFQNQARSLLVWLEFWKLKIVDFFREYGGEIKALLKLLIAYKALKTVFVISDVAYMSLVRYRRALRATLLLQQKYLALMGPAIGTKFSRWLQSLAVFMPKWLRRAWVAIGKFLLRLVSGDFNILFKRLYKSLFGLKPLFNFLIKGARLFFGFLKNVPAIFMAIVRAGRALMAALLGSNPVGWIVLAITLLAVLYAKCRSFRTFVNNMFKIWLEYVKLLWNSLMYIVTWLLVGIKKIWDGVKWLWGKIIGFFAWMWDGIKSLWSAFKDTSVGKFLDDYVVRPIRAVFEFVAKVWNKVIQGLGEVAKFFGMANDSISTATKNVADKYGVWHLPTFDTGNINTNDGTNYLNPFRNSSGSENVANPIIDSDNGTVASVPALSGGTSATTSMTFGSGAIQIVVQKGEGIDENKLAQKIKKVILDMKREGDMRGGTL